MGHGLSRDAVNTFPAALPAALEGPANAIHGIGARRTAKVHRIFGSGSPSGDLKAASLPSAADVLSR